MIYDFIFQFINRTWSDRTSIPAGPENVGGVDRYKYFRRPIVPYAQAPVDVILEPQKPQINQEEDTSTYCVSDKNN